jgi:RNA recognition motif-containing protein
MPFDYEKNENKGYGFITYSKASEAARAIEESNKMYVLVFV